MNADDLPPPLYFLVAEGIEASAFDAISGRFNTRRGGCRPDGKTLYASIPVLAEKISESVEWLVVNISFESIKILVWVRSPLGWANYELPASLLAAASRFETRVEVSFGAQQGIQADGFAAA